jgi:hypothetical protein
MHDPCAAVYVSVLSCSMYPLDVSAVFCDSRQPQVQLVEGYCLCGRVWKRRVTPGAGVPALLQNVMDQLRLWEQETMRIIPYDAYVYDFEQDSDELYQRTLGYAQQLGAVLWESSTPNEKMFACDRTGGLRAGQGSGHAIGERFLVGGGGAEQEPMVGLVRLLWAPGRVRVFHDACGSKMHTCSGSLLSRCVVTLAICHAWACAAEPCNLESCPAVDSCAHRVVRPDVCAWVPCFGVLQSTSKSSNTWCSSSCSWSRSD